VLALLPRGWIAFAAIVPILVVGLGIGLGPFVTIREPLVEAAFVLVGVGAGMAALVQGIRLALPPRLLWVYILLVLVMPVLLFIVVVSLLSANWPN
jgi:hypothetical protein